MTDTAVSTGIPAPTLQVIGAGFGRTGTASMREALVRLGFGPCDHMVENFEHQERFALWDEARRRKDAGEPIDWRPLLSGFQAIVDWPGAYFWEELTAAHPEAKVVLTVRDPRALVRQHSANDFHLAGRPVARGAAGHHLHPHLRRSAHGSRALPGRLYQAR